jgi:hypothetical protein
MLEQLASSLTLRHRWHALFDVRLLQARIAAGLPADGDLTCVTGVIRGRLDEASLAACREVGWPLLEEGQVAAGWMYLRAAATVEEVACRLATLVAAMPLPPPAGDAEADRRLHEILGVALWEGVDPALGIDLIIRTRGTCNAITAYEQAVSRLPAARQQAAADRLVSHLHEEVTSCLEADLRRRGLPLPADDDDRRRSLPALLEAAGGLHDDPAVHVDVSHLQSVLRIARVCTAPRSIVRAWELACYGCRLPSDAVYSGEPPFESMAEASRHFFGAQAGREVATAVGFFRRAAARATVEGKGPLPADTLALLLWRLGRPAEALVAALERPADDGRDAAIAGLPSLVELAAAGNAWDVLRQACRSRGDEVTFAATLAAERQQTRTTKH